MPQSPGAIKRQKELARLEWQKEKAERKRQRKIAAEKGEVDASEKPAEQAPAAAPQAPETPKP